MIRRLKYKYNGVWSFHIASLILLYDSTDSRVVFSIMLPVEILGVDAIKLAHTFRQISIGSFKYDMVVVAHQTIGVNTPVTSLTDSG